MKIFKALSLMGVTAAMLSSCSFFGGSDDLNDNIDYIPVQEQKDGKWGMVGPGGKMLFSEEYKNCPSLVINGIFSVEEGDKEGENVNLYEAGAKPKVILEGLYAAGYCNCGVIPVTFPKQRIQIVDKSGKVKGTLEPVKGKEIVSCDNAFQEDMIYFCTEEGKYGYANTKGEVVISPEYTNAEPFSEGLAVVRKEIKTDDDTEKVYLVINKKGEEQFRLKKGFYPMGDDQFKDGLLAVRDDDGRFGFMDTKGEFTKMSGKVQGINEYTKDRFVFVNDSHEYGVMDMEGEVIVRPRYQGVQMLPDGNYLVKDGEDYLILDKKGDKKEVISDYEYVIYLNKKFGYIAKSGSKAVFIDEKGKLLNKDEYTDISFRQSNNYIIYSDYFNTEAVVAIVADQLKKNGIGKYTLGATVSDLGLGTSGNMWSTQLDASDQIDNGYRYTTRLQVGFDDYIAKREYYGWSSYETLNGSAKVNVICLGIDAQTAFWTAAKAPLIAAIKAKGFNVKAEGKNAVTFTGNGAGLVLVADPNGKDVNVFLCPTEVATDYNVNINDGEEVAAEVAYDNDEWDDTVSPIVREVAPEAE